MITLASIYAMNYGQIVFLEDIFDFREGKFIIAGDFNYIANLSQDTMYSNKKKLQTLTHTKLQWLSEKKRKKNLY